MLVVLTTCLVCRPGKRRRRGQSHTLEFGISCVLLLLLCIFKPFRGCPRSGVARGAGCERAEAAAPEHHKPVGIDWTNSNIFSDVLLPIFQWHVFPRIWRDLKSKRTIFLQQMQRLAKEAQRRTTKTKRASSEHPWEKFGINPSASWLRPTNRAPLATCLACRLPSSKAPVLGLVTDPPKKNVWTDKALGLIAARERERQFEEQHWFNLRSHKRRCQPMSADWSLSQVSVTCQPPLTEWKGGHFSMRENCHFTTRYLGHFSTRQGSFLNAPGLLLRV